MTLRKKFSLWTAAAVAAIGLTIAFSPDIADAQTNSGPIVSPRYNTDYYIGVAPYPSTIQSAVTAACASTLYTHKGTVIVLPGLVASDSPTAATGCVGVGIIVKTALPWVCYAWTGSGPYAVTSCTGGSSGTCATCVTITPTFGANNAIPASIAGGRAVNESNFLLDSVNGFIQTKTAGQAVSVPVANPPPIIGTSATIAGTLETVTTHGTFAYVVIAGTPATVATVDVSPATPVLVGSPFSLPCNSAYGAVYIQKVGATDDSGYLAVACFSTNQLIVLNVSAAGTVTSGATLSGLTAAAIYNNPYDSTHHILYVNGFNNGNLYPVNLTNPLSPSLGTTIALSLGSGGGCLLTGQTSAPGNGYLYISLGTECGGTSEAQVYTAAGTRVGFTALDHAPQRMRQQGKYTYTVEHDSAELQIVDNSNVLAPVLVTTLTIPSCLAEEMTMSDGFLYVSCDDAGMRKVNIENPNRPYVVSTTSGYTGFSAALAFSGHYLVGISGSSVVNTDIGGSYSPHILADAATIRRLEVETLFARALYTNGPLFALGYLQFGGSASQIPNSGVLCQWDGITATNCPPSSANPMSALGDTIYGGASGAPTRLAGNITAVANILCQIGTGTISAAPAWCTYLGTATPLMDGSAAVGTSPLLARQDHAHPVDTSRAAATASTTANGVACQLSGTCAVLPILCADVSGSGTAQTCATTPSFTLGANQCFTYTSTTANSSTALTLNVNGLGAKSVGKIQGNTTTLAIGDHAANLPVQACYNGTNIYLTTVANTSAGAAAYTVRSVSASTDTLLNADCGNGVVYTNTAVTVAIGLPQAGASSQFLNGCKIDIINGGAGILKVTATTSTFIQDGYANFLLAPRQSGYVVSDGTNYSRIFGNAAVIAKLGASDTLTCSTIGTTETAFATTFTIPDNFYNAGRAIEIFVLLDATASGAGPLYTTRMKFGATTIYSNAQAGASAAATIHDGLNYVSQGTATPGASVNVQTDLTAYAGDSLTSHAGGANSITQPVALATNGTLAVTFTLQCSAATAGNNVSLKQLGYRLSE